ncbi:hypothetical protein ABPG75_008571 [Micractinium tetrahymenae]
MAARLAALVSKARAAAEPVVSRASSEVVKQYDGLMAKNAQYVIKDKEAADKLLKQYVFTQLARIPHGVQQCKAEAGVIRQKWANLRELPTTEVATYVGFAAELYAWFCIGEIIGRGGSLTGYSV